MSVLITGSGLSFGSGRGRIGAFAAGSAGCGACPLNITPIAANDASAATPTSLRFVPISIVQGPGNSLIAMSLREMCLHHQASARQKNWSYLVGQRSEEH